MKICRKLYKINYRAARLNENASKQQQQEKEKRGQCYNLLRVLADMNKFGAFKIRPLEDTCRHFSTLTSTAATAIQVQTEGLYYSSHDNDRLSY